MEMAAETWYSVPASVAAPTLTLQQNSLVSRDHLAQFDASKTLMHNPVGRPTPCDYGLYIPSTWIARG
jgi:hypothetical protein